MYADQKIKPTPPVCVCVFSMLSNLQYKTLPVPSPQYTVWLIDSLAVSPAALFTLRLQDCKKIYISEREPAGGAESFSCRTSYLWNKPPCPCQWFRLDTFQIHTQELKFSTACNPQPRASLSSPAVFAGIVGWRDVISGYAVVCVWGGTHRQWYTVHMRNCTHSPSVSLSCK